MDERIFIMKKVANDLFAVETAIEAALASTATFAAGLPEARTRLNLSAVVGQDVFDGAIAAVAALNDARRQIVETHKALDVTKTKMGMRTVAFGSLGKLMQDAAPTPISRAA